MLQQARLGAGIYEETLPLHVLQALNKSAGDTSTVKQPGIVRHSAENEHLPKLAQSGRARLRLD